jgi:hypothetical protein
LAGKASFTPPHKKQKTRGALTDATLNYFVGDAGRKARQKINLFDLRTLSVNLTPQQICEAHQHDECATQLRNAKRHH